jgi:hypothetical protein
MLFPTKAYQANPATRPEFPSRSSSNLMGMGTPDLVAGHELLLLMRAVRLRKTSALRPSRFV